MEELLVRLLSPEMMDEIVFLEKSNMYPYCAEAIRSKLNYYEKWEARRNFTEVEAYEFAELKRLKLAIIEGQRENHLSYLAECKKMYSLQLEKKVKGIQYIV